MASLEKRASVVVPARNEVNGIGPFLTSMIRAVDALPNPSAVDVFVVDDGSTDATRPLVQVLTHGRKNFHIVGLPRGLGVGHARRNGAAQTYQERDHLIISTDADAEIPESWLHDWLSVAESGTSRVIAGDIEFPDTLRETHPNVFTIRQIRKRVVAVAEDIFGVINTGGANSAVRNREYNVVGGFNQSHMLREGSIEKIPGEDWDIGMKARIMGIPVERSPYSPVIVSPRRLFADPISFITGKAYEHFDRVDADTAQNDIPPTLMEEVLGITMKKWVKSYISTPLLADSHLIHQPKVQAFLGEELAAKIKIWLQQNPKPDFFEARNKFLFEYLDEFHGQFGYAISGVLFQAPDPELQRLLGDVRKLSGKDTFGAFS